MERSNCEGGSRVGCHSHTLSRIRCHFAGQSASIAATFVATVTVKEGRRHALLESLKH
jgi:hypothetical protein